MRNTLLIGGCVLSLLTTGCIKDLDYTKNRVTNSDYFDFKTDQATSLSVDYCFPNTDYPVLFEIYGQNPQTQNEEGELIKLDIEPIYRATTDGSGKLQAEGIQLPAHLTTVWIYSKYTGVLSPVEVEIKDNKIEFNQNDYIAQLRKSSTRAVTGNKRTYPDEWLTLGDWDIYGTPDYLEKEQTMPPGSTLYSINDVFVNNSQEKLKNRYPGFFEEGLIADLRIIKPTKVYLVFINSTAAWKSTVGYYTYPTGQEPQTPSDVKRIMAFPSASPFIRKSGTETIRGALVGGDRLQLKYWDGKQFQEEFPAGVSIGWWLEGRSFLPEGNVEIQGKGFYSRFSTERLNKDKERRIVALRDAKSDQIVAIGFEDNIDLRYNDATFYLEFDKGGAIDETIPTLPEVDGGPSDAENFVKTDGFLMFEDIWPYGGDYDMNDVMIKYSTKTYKHILNNLVYKIETEYTPFHNGGRIQSGFGIQFADLSMDAIRKVTITGATPSVYMEGQMLEPGQRRPTIILSDNITGSIGSKINLKVELNDAPESFAVTPFNPFIIPESDKERIKEIHLVKQMPTDKVDQSLFGTGRDGSNPRTKLYYVMARNEKQYPFALNMPFMQNIPIPEETVNIDISYPKFRNWVESDGKTNKDWYLYPAKK